MEELKDFEVIKVLNNSACIVSKNNEEMILLGKGIAFGLKADTHCNYLDGIEKMYILNQEGNRLREIFSSYSNIDTNISLDVLRYLQAKKIPMPKLISLLDHLSIMLKRVKNNEAIENPFAVETKILYQSSFQKALDLCKFLSDKYHFTIPEGEAAFLALHIENINRAQQEVNVGIMNKIMIDVKDLLSQYNLSLDEESIDYTRFVSHIRFTVARISNHEKSDIMVNPVNYGKYPLEYEIAEKILEIIQRHIGEPVDPEEIGLLMIHIHRFVVKG